MSQIFMQNEKKKGRGDIWYEILHQINVNSQAAAHRNYNWELGVQPPLR